jgi:hypothetical protein
MCRGHGEPNIRNEDIHLHRRNADTHYSNEAISEDLRRQKNRQYWWNKKTSRRREEWCLLKAVATAIRLEREITEPIAQRMITTKTDN